MERDWAVLEIHSPIAEVVPGALDNAGGDDDASLNFRGNWRCWEICVSNLARSKRVPGAGSGKAP
jgi:hypothetical protein